MTITCYLYTWKRSLFLWLHKNHAFHSKKYQVKIHDLVCHWYYVTALFINKPILKFKSQLTFALFAAVNHLNRPHRKQKFTSTNSKRSRHGLWFVIGGFRSVLCVSVFQGLLLAIIIINIMIDGSKERNGKGGLWASEFTCFWKAQ